MVKRKSLILILKILSPSFARLFDAFWAVVFRPQRSERALSQGGSRTIIGTSRTQRDPSQAFVGRKKDIKIIEGMLFRSLSKGRTTVVIEGAPGIGKTELAVQLVHKFLKEQLFPGGIYYLSSSKDLTFEWASIAEHHMGIRSGTMVERANAAIKWIENTEDKILLVLDNVEDWSPEMRPSPLPDGSHVSLLLTTRKMLLGGVVMTGRHCLLELSQADSRVLINKVTRGKFSRAGDRFSLSELKPLHDMVGGHPLALEQAGYSILRFGGIGPYCQELCDGGARVVHDSVRHSIVSQETLDSVLRKAWLDLSPKGQEAWLVAARFQDEPATRRLAHACGIDEAGFAELSSGSLVRPDGGEGCWTMLKAFRAFGRTQAGDESSRAKAKKQFHSGCVALASEMTRTGGSKIYRPDQAHYDLAAETAPDHQAALLYDRIGAAQRSSGQYVDAVNSKKKALAYASGLSADVGAEIRFNLAMVYVELRNFKEALKHQKYAFETMSKIFGEYDPQLIPYRCNLALLFIDLGRSEEAQEHLSKLKERSESNLETSPYAGLVLKKLGNFWDARLCYYQWLKFADAQRSSEQMALAHSNIGQVSQKLGDLREARKHLKEAVRLGTKVWGEEHPRLAMDHAFLSSTCKQLGKTSEAITHKARALSVAAGLILNSRARVAIDAELG